MTRHLDEEGVLGGVNAATGQQLYVMEYEQQDTQSDRMLLQKHFFFVQTLVGDDFEVDCFCNDDGSNSHCAVFCSPSQPFQTSELPLGKVCWCNPPYRSIDKYLDAYYGIKRQDPSTSSAWLLPKWNNATWYNKVSADFQLVHEWEKGPLLFSQPAEMGKEKTWDQPPGLYRSGGMGQHN